MLADGVEYDVVGLAVLREVLLCVVDHLTGSERSQELDVLGVAHRGDIRAEVPGKLHGSGADRPRGAVDNDPLPRPETRLPEARERTARSITDGRSLLVGHTGRLVRHGSALPYTDVLGVGT